MLLYIILLLVQLAIALPIKPQVSGKGDQKHICDKLHAGGGTLHLQSFTYIRRNPAAGFNVMPNKFDLLLIESQNVYKLTINSKGSNLSLTVPRHFEHWSRFFHLQSTPVQNLSPKFQSLYVFNSASNRLVVGAQMPGYHIALMTSEAEYLWSQRDRKLLNNSDRIHAKYSLILNPINQGFLIHDGVDNRVGGVLALHSFYYQINKDNFGEGRAWLKSRFGPFEKRAFFSVEMTESPEWISLVPSSKLSITDKGLFRQRPTGFVHEEHIYLIETPCVYIIPLFDWAKKIRANVAFSLPLKIVPIERFLNCGQNASSIDDQQCLSRWSKSEEPKPDDNDDEESSKDLRKQKPTDKMVKLEPTDAEPSSDMSDDSSLEEKPPSKQSQNLATLSIDHGNGNESQTEEKSSMKANRNKDIFKHKFYRLGLLIWTTLLITGSIFLLIFVVVMIVLSIRIRKMKPVSFPSINWQIPPIRSPNSSSAVQPEQVTESMAHNFPQRNKPASDSSAISMISLTSITSSGKRVNSSTSESSSAESSEQESSAKVNIMSKGEEVAMSHPSQSVAQPSAKEIESRPEVVIYDTNSQSEQKVSAAASPSDASKTAHSTGKRSMAPNSPGLKLVVKARGTNPPHLAAAQDADEKKINKSPPKSKSWWPF